MHAKHRGRRALLPALLACMAMLAAAATAGPADAAPPANDDFAAAVDLGTTLGDVAPVDVRGATAEPGEPEHAPTDPSGGRRTTVWYRWTAERDGVLAVHVEGAEVALAPALHAGDRVDALTPVMVQGKEARSAHRFRVEPGRTYALAIDQTSRSDPSPGRLHLAFESRPANDDLSRATVLSGLTAEGSGTTRGATYEPGETDAYDGSRSNPSRSVWFAWTAPATGGVLLEPGATGVFTGNRVDALQRIAVTRAGGRSWFRVVQGTTYRIVVDLDPDGRATESFSFRLSWQPPPANDDLADAQWLGASPEATIRGENAGAGGEAWEPRAHGVDPGSVWYRWTAPGRGALQLKSVEGQRSGSVSAFTGSAPDDLTPVSFSWGQMDTDAGETYAIAVGGGPREERGPFAVTLEWTPAPANDELPAATPILPGGGTVRGTLVGATNRGPGEYPELGPTVWYRWTPAATGRASLDLTDGISVLVRTGPPDDPRTKLVYPGGDFRADAGTTYWLGVQYRGSRTRFGDRFSITATLTPSPSNDDRANAHELHGEAAAGEGTSVGATGEHGDDGWAITHNRAVWWRWTAPSDGVATLSAAAGADNGDTRVAAYYEVDGTLHRVGLIAFSQLTFDASRGVTYWLMVHAHRAGPLAVELAHAPDPPRVPPFPDAPPVEEPTAEEPPPGEPEPPVVAEPTPEPAADPPIAPGVSTPPVALLQTPLLPAPQPISVAPPARSPSLSTPRTTALTITRRARIATLLDGRLTGTVRCPGACPLTATVTVRGRRLPLHVVRRGTHFSLRADATARRWLRDASRATVTVRAGSTARTVTLRR